MKTLFAQVGAPWRTWDPHHALYNPSTSGSGSNAVMAPATPEEINLILISMLIMVSPLIFAFVKYHVEKLLRSRK